MHPIRKALPFRFLAIIIAALLCLVLLPAQARVLEDPPLPSGALLAPLDDMPPTTLSVDEQGYIT